MNITTHMYGDVEIRPYIDSLVDDETNEEFQAVSDSVEEELIAQLEAR
jgi:hypothetical protein